MTFLPAGEIAEMSRTLKNLSAKHLHHPDLIELQYLTRLHGAENASSFRAIGHGIAGAHRQRELLLRLLRHRDGSHRHADPDRLELSQLLTI